MFVGVFCSKEWSLELVIMKVLHPWTWLLKIDYLMLIFTIQVVVILSSLPSTCSLSISALLSVTILVPVLGRRNWVVCHQAWRKTDNLDWLMHLIWLIHLISF